jgi:alkanesulfonate monooxygenase SsuD/methylene tetrahydromethanopterin reductase-like flavin-dependent oxidoreductase (luciferase family)
MRDVIGAERGWGPTSRAEYDREIERGSLYVGAPDTVARKIAATARALGIARFDLKYSAGALAHDRMLRSIALYGREVAPRVRALLAAEASEGSALGPGAEAPAAVGGAPEPAR